MSDSAPLAVFALGGLALAGAAWYASRQQGAVEVKGEGAGVPWSLPDDISMGLGDAYAAVDEVAGAAVAEAAPFVYTLLDFAGGAPTAGDYNAMNEEQNTAAFLRMVRLCEVGTAGATGYRTLFGGGTFSSFADHPRQRITRTINVNGAPKSIVSTAAGAYQILEGTWNDARRALGLPDFSPASQDAAALWLLRRRNALNDVRAGNFTSALTKAAREWASLPGSPYGQPVRSLDQVMAFYTAGGGDIAGGVLA